MSKPVDYAFLHGGGQGGWVWDHTIAALDRQTEGKFGRALALDVPGCGKKRGRQTDNLGLIDVARELLADLDDAGMRDVVLVGHSQAGNVLPALVETRPGLFRRLVYVSCSIPLPGQTVLELMGTGLHGSNENEVGWPSDPKVGDIRERYPSMFCNDMSPSETTAFMAKVGSDAWPMPIYSHTDWRFEKPAAALATYVVCLRDGILPVALAESFCDTLQREPARPHRRRTSGDDYAAACAGGSAAR